MLKFMKDYDCGTYVVSKSENGYGYKFKGSYDEVVKQYAPTALCMFDVIGELEEQGLFLFRELLELRYLNKVFAQGDIEKDMIDFIAESLRFHEYEVEPNIEKLIAELDNHTDYKLSRILEEEV